MNLRCHELALNFYREIKDKKFPTHIKSQLLRATVSISLNLSEGWGRKSVNDRKRFYQIAFGSIREVQSVTKLEPSLFTNKELALLDYLAASTFKLIHTKPGKQLA